MHLVCPRGTNLWVVEHDSACSAVSNICTHAGCRDAARVATVHCVLFIGSTSAEPHDEVWWSEGSMRSGSLKVHSLTTGATQVPRL